MNKRFQTSNAGFSMVQSVIVVAIIGVLAAIGFTHVTQISEGARLTKLESDVAAINQSIQVYLANGGILTDAISFGVWGDPIEQKVIDKLKTRRNQFSAETYSGLKAEMIDKRLAVLMQTDSEAISSEQRAVWNAAENRFEIKTIGKGVKLFYLNAQLAHLDYGIDEGRRSSAINVNDESGWIWAYDDSSSPTNLPGPTLIPTGGTTGDDADGGDTSGDSAGDDGDGEGEELTKLNPPRIDPRSGTYQVTEFPLTVTVINTNTDYPDTWIMVQVNSGGYQRYEGPFTVEPNTSVRAYVTGMTEVFETSSTAYAYYTTKLRTPSFSPWYGRQYPMTDFPMEVTIRNYNDPETFVMYALDDGEYQRYTEPISVPGGTKVSAYIESPDERWERSSTRSGTYEGYKLDLPQPQLYTSAPEFNADVSTITVSAELPADTEPGAAQIQYAITAKDAPAPDRSAFISYAGPISATYDQYPTGFTFYAYAKSLNTEVWNDGPANSVSTSVDFFGVGVAQSTLFVLDFSGSMDQRFFGSSKTRLQVLKEEMDNALGGSDINENDEIGVMLFSSKPWWVSPDGLVEVESSTSLSMYSGTTANKSAISSVINATEDKRYTNYARALEAVGQINPPPAQIIFLTDGAPTVGDGSTADDNNSWFTGLSEIIGLGVPVHTIGVDLKNQSRADRLEYISEQTGGTSQLVGDTNLVPDSWEPPG